MTIVSSPTLKVLYITGPNEYKDITNMMTNATLSGDINTLPRTLELTLQNSMDPKKGRLINFEPGKMIMFYINGAERFRGYIFKAGINEKGEQSLTAYDQLIYLTKNAETMLIKNKSASDVIVSMLNKYKFPIAKIEPTGYKISKKACQGQAIADIFSDCLEETKTATGKNYMLWTLGGLVYLESRQNAVKVTLSVPDIIGGSYEISIEDTRTSVMVEKGQIDSDDKENKYTVVSASDSAATAKYGLMQHIESADDEATKSKMQTTANQLLKQLSKPQETFSFDYFGHYRAVTGNMLEIYNNTLGFMGQYYITSDSHTFEGGTHKMSLQLSKTLE